jgi:RNA polymerase sigma-70 factor (ECF subfamily)
VTEADAVDAFVRNLHERHADALYGFALRRIGDASDAADIVQEALVRAWRHQYQYDPARGSERQWLFGITRNLVSDRRRKERRRGLRVVGDSAAHEAGALDEDLERVTDTSLVVDALGRLSGEHRTVILEAYYQGRSTSEIAERLGIPAGTVKSRLFYGLRALRAALEEDGVLR